MSTINYWITKNWLVTNFLHLSHNNKWEMFFRILWNEITPTTFYDWIKNKVMDIKWIDHVSFHDDWLIHFRYKNKENKSRKLEHMNIKKEFFSIPDDNYLWLIIFSIYDFDLFKKYIWKIDPLLFDWKDNKTYNLQLKDKNKFSIVVFLLWNDVDYIWLLLKFNGIFNLDESILLEILLTQNTNIELDKHFITEFNGKRLLLAFTDKTIKQHGKNLFPIPTKEDIINIWCSFWLNIISSDDKINSLI